MKSFRSFLILTIMVSVLIGIAYISEFFYLVAVIISLIGIIIIFFESKDEISEYELYKDKLERLMVYMKQQGHEIPDCLESSKNIYQINYKIHISYINERDEIIRDSIYANLSSDIDINNVDKIKDAIYLNRKIYNLPDEFSVIFAVKN